MPYTANKPQHVPSAASLRARIPGWGADLDPADRPSGQQERFTATATGAHWEFPDQQPETVPRERSIEHQHLTPVFGTAAPLHGLSGALRRLAYRRYSEARAAHWLVLIGADRVDAVESHLRSFRTLHPDNPVTQTGVLSEFTHRPVSSRIGRKRADTRHIWIDPILVGAPWAVCGATIWVLLLKMKKLIRGR